MVLFKRKEKYIFSDYSLRIFFFTICQYKGATKEYKLGVLLTVLNTDWGDTKGGRVLLE